MTTKTETTSVIISTASCHFQSWFCSQLKQTYTLQSTCASSSPSIQSPDISLLHVLVDVRISDFGSILVQFLVQNYKSKKILIAPCSILLSTSVGIPLPIEVVYFQLTQLKMIWTLKWNETRPDTRLPQSRVGGQGPYLRSLDHLGRSSKAKDRKKTKK